MAPKAASSLSSHTATSCAVTGGGSQTDSGSRDGAVHNPPEILALEPELHLVNPDIVIGPIKDGDCYFDVVGSGGRHVVDRFLKRSLSARDLSLKKLTMSMSIRVLLKAKYTYLTCTDGWKRLQTK